MLTTRLIRWAQCARLMKNYGSAQPNLAQRWKNFALSTLYLRVHPDQRRAASGRCNQKSKSHRDLMLCAVDQLNVDMLEVFGGRVVDCRRRIGVAHCANSNEDDARYGGTKYYDWPPGLS